MKNSPAMITMRTTATLMATTTEVTRADSFMPTTRMAVSTSTRAKARMSKPNPSATSGPESTSGIVQSTLSISERT
ncbi:hypothetical protein SCYAM73S_03467 [Streptomyces cyaneofuscatus]